MQETPWLERVIAGDDVGSESTTELYAYLPYRGCSNGPWIRRTLGRIHLSPAIRDGLKVWKLSPKYMLPLAQAMADEYGEIELRLHTSGKIEKCTPSCKTAYAHTVGECVCICGGKHHGGEDQYSDWYSAGRFQIRRRGEITVRHVTITRGQLQSADAPDTEPEEVPIRTEPPARPRLKPSPSPTRTAPSADWAHSPESSPRQRLGHESRQPIRRAPASPVVHQPSHVVRVPTRSAIWPTVAAALMAVAIGSGVWWTQHQGEEHRQVSDYDTVQPGPPASGTFHDPSPAPLPPAVPEQPSLAPEDHPCWPFQAAC
ncbi:hypothetical protein [Nocardia carnea]|uniref:hypothetical protein n=1 Tax=Nocardia carnea TaxID=37328 RepID=UPI002456ACAD|nr:hypothetical protein [Nocardia carnea]